VECYGGGLWHTWFDRELSVAGEEDLECRASKQSEEINDVCRGAGSVIVQKPDGSFSRELVHVKRPLLRIPNLCIHLQTADERSKLEVNKESHLVPLLAMADAALNKTSESDGGVVDQRHGREFIGIIAAELGCNPDAIKDFDLTLFDTQGGQCWGASEEFVSAPRLDNQVHCFTSVEALIEHCKVIASDEDVNIVALFDHEEVGSESTHGAGSPIILDIIERVGDCINSGSSGEFQKISIHKSFIISADVAHAVHPNYASKHEANHSPLLNGGMVIKTNNNQRYATNAVTGFVVRELARRAAVPVKVQEFCVRNDCPCGSTIGPMVSALTGIRTVDIGIPSLSMHSIRETVGTQDVADSKKLFMSFFQNFRSLDKSCQF
jgi:aspartyl aminopeptidase